MPKKLREILFFKNLKGIGDVQINKKFLPVIQNELDGLGACINYVKNNIEKITDDDIAKASQRSDLILDTLDNDKSIKAITVLDNKYPSRLDIMGNNKPVILYAKGNIDLLTKKCIAIVGTREPEKWTSDAAGVLVEKVITGIGNENIAIVSGLALGCDKIAHEKTLDNHGYTIAVLPSGVNVITPSSHKTLAKQILDKNGCLISEYEPTAKVTKSSYVKRDKLVAALCGLTMVLQCDVKSGTMHTVRAAVEYGRKTACFGASNLKNMMFTGNKFMIDTYDSVKIMNSDDMIKLVQSLVDTDNVRCEEEYKQMSLV